MSETPPAVVNVVLCDKSPLVLSGLVQLFGDSDEFRVVATAADGERFLEAVGKFDFDIGVIGWKMPYMDGREVLRRLAEQADAPRIVIYTGDGGASVSRQAMIEGAAGFCAKDEAPERLVETVHAVAAGRMVFPFMDVRAAFADPLESLTDRESELLKALSDGLTNAQVAERMGISLNTVKFHLKNLYDKLDVRNRAQAVARYLHGPT